MANYPASIFSPRTKANRNGVVYDSLKETVIFAEDMQADDNEIVAIETELGTNPKGAYASVAAFLADLLAKVISVFTDLSDVPASYVDQAGKFLKVKATEDGLEFGTGGAGAGAFTDLSDVPASYVDQAGKVVKVKATEDGLEFGEGGGAVDLFAKFIDFIHWQDIAGFTTALSAGSTITVNDAVVTLSVPATSTYKAFMVSKVAYYGVCNTGKVVSIEFTTLRLTSVAAQTIYLLFGTSAGSPPADYDYKLGFKIVNARIHTVTSDGGDCEDQDTGVDTDVGYIIHRYKIVYTKNTEAKFYFDGVLIATHTTYLPDLGYPKINVGIVTNAAAAKIVNLGRILIEAEYP